MKYIRKFETDSEYQANKTQLEEQGLYLSYTQQTDKTVLYYEKKQYPMPYDNEYVDQYLTIEALEENTNVEIILGNNFEQRSMIEFYTSWNGGPWQKYQLPYISGPSQYIGVSLSEIGTKLYLKAKVRNYDVTFNSGIGLNPAEYNWEIKIKPRNNVKVYGNIMSMVYGDKFQNKTRMPNSTTMIFHNMFADSHFTDVENLMLPCVELQPYLYADMFKGSGITKSPILPAEILTTGCYNRMFYNCSSLNTIKCLNTTEFDSLYSNDWVKGVAQSGTFYYNRNLINTYFGDYGIPLGWLSTNLN